MNTIQCPYCGSNLIENDGFVWECPQCSDTSAVTVDDYAAVNDGFGVIGYIWYCKGCGVTMKAQGDNYGNVTKVFPVS